MDYEHPFVQEVRANPHDDAPRLIFADYLEEAGDPQGELIRVQVALSHLPAGDPDRRELELRESELLGEFADQWLAPLRELGAQGVSARSFQRGLIERVRMNVGDFFHSAEELCRRAPALYRLELRGVRENVALLRNLDFPPQISALDLCSNQLEPRDFDPLGYPTWMDQIQDLSLAFNQLDDSTARALMRIPWKRLSRLNLAANRLGPDAVSAIANRYLPPQLEALQLSVNKTGDMGLQLLANSAMATTLRDLDLGTTGVTTAGLARLVASPLLSNLEVLSLRGNVLGEDSERALAALASAPRLKRLDLRGTHRELARHGYGSALQEPPPALRERLGEGLLW